MPDDQNYLYDAGQRREREAIRRLIVGPPLFEQHLRFLDWHLPFGWLGLSIPTGQLTRTLPSEAPGDVDILGGALEPLSPRKLESALAATRRHPYLASLKLVADGTIRWPPNLARLSAAECKAVRFTTQGRLKRRSLGPTDQEDARAAARGLCACGFDSVALIRFVVGQPDSSRVGQAWMHAGSIASDVAEHYMTAVVSSRRDPFKSIVLSVGAVDGGIEDLRGAGAGYTLHGSHRNPFRRRATSAAARKEIEHSLTRVLTATRFPRRIPVVVLACSRRRACGRLYVSSSDATEPCPTCSAPSTFMKE